MFSTTLAGTPATTELAGTFFVTTEFAAIMQLSPIVTLGRIIAFHPILQLSPITIRPYRTDSLSTSPNFLKVHILPSCVISWTLCVNLTLLAIETKYGSSPMTIVFAILQPFPIIIPSFLNIFINCSFEQSLIFIFRITDFSFTIPCAL